MTRILSECSASVRKSLQGLDYFATERARAFDDLSLVLEQAVEVGASKERVQGLQEALKAGKLYLKGDLKVIFFCPMRVYFNQSQNWGKIGEKPMLRVNMENDG